MALTVKFQEMAFYFKSSLAGEPVLEPLKVTVGKVNNFTTTGTYQVMMVLGGPSHKVALSVRLSMYFADKTEGEKKVERSVDGYPAYTGIFAAYSIV